MDRDTQRKLDIINRQIPPEWKRKLMEKTDKWQAEKNYLREGIKKSEKFFGSSSVEKKRRENARQHLKNLESIGTTEEVSEKYSKKIDKFVSGKIIAGIKRGDLKRVKQDRTWRK